MDFAQPQWLFIGVIACVSLFFLFRYMEKRRRTALGKFTATQLIGRLTRNISGNRRRYKNMLLLLAVFLCFSALARPQYGFQWVDVQRKGIDLLFALDTSKSMLAEDIRPNRLKRAHLAILDFVQQLEGDRVGLIPFAGSAYVMCPLTLDYAAFEDSLSAITTDLIPRGGTNMAAVIEKAVDTLSNAANHKILIILTDGENLEGDAVKAAENAATAGLTIYTVGVGTSQGELIPIANDHGKGFVKDNKGNFVTSRLDEKTLSTLASKSGGLYVPLGSGGEGLETIYQQKLALIPKDELAERRHKVPLERFEWPLAAAVLLLALELLVGETRKTGPLPFFRTMRRTIGRGRKITGLSAILFLLSLNIGTKAYSSEGEEAFLQGDYLQASEYYRSRLEKSPDDPELQYNYGTAAYKNNMYDDAVDAFSKALKSDNVELQEKAYYNRGNSQYQKGVEIQQADPKETISQWQQALSSLQSALELNPEDADARHNHTVITKRLEELQQQQQQNEENQQDQKKENDPKDQEQDTNQQQDQKKQQTNENQSGEQPAGSQEGQGEEQQQPEPSRKSNNEANAPTPADRSQEEMKNEDALRQQLGKMTREEAERLLNGLKNEEGELNFVPSGRSGNDNNIDKDW
ncbi:MAG: VWA domain-containing protein [Desulforhopalus sp.]